MYDYLRIAQLLENLMLTETEAEEVIQTIKEISEDTVALPSSYRAVKKVIMPALNDR